MLVCHKHVLSAESQSQPTQLSTDRRSCSSLNFLQGPLRLVGMQYLSDQLLRNLHAPDRQSKQVQAEDDSKFDSPASGVSSDGREVPGARLACLESWVPPEPGYTHPASLCASDFKPYPCTLAIARGSSDPCSAACCSHKLAWAPYTHQADAASPLQCWLMPDRLDGCQAIRGACCRQGTSICSVEERTDVGFAAGRHQLVLLEGMAACIGSLQQRCT